MFYGDLQQNGACADWLESSVVGKRLFSNFHFALVPMPLVGIEIQTVSFYFIKKVSDFSNPWVPF